MLRIAALLFTLLIAACSTAPIAAPSASPSASPTVAATSSPAITPPATSAPSAVVRTPIPLPNNAQIDAPSSSVVWVLVGDQNGRLFRSADRGETWRESTLPPAGPVVLSFIDDREGWAMVTRIGLLPPAGAQCGSPVQLAHTADAGMTWQEIATSGLESPGPCKSTVHFTDAQRGFIAAFDPAGSPLVYRTADGGRSWTRSSRLPDPPGFTTRAAQGPRLGVRSLAAFGTTLLLSAFPDDPATGTRYVYRSSDGGATWVYATTAPNTVQDVTFVTATRWLQISSPGDAKETTDGGSSWHAFVTTYQQAAPVAPVVLFGDAQVGYATVRGTIQRTVDGGVTWSSIRTPGTF